MRRRVPTIRPPRLVTRHEPENGEAAAVDRDDGAAVDRAASDRDSIDARLMIVGKEDVGWRTVNRIERKLQWDDRCLHRRRYADDRLNILAGDQLTRWQDGERPLELNCAV